VTQEPDAGEPGATAPGSRLPTEDLVRRAGITAELAAGLVEGGLIQPDADGGFGDGAVRRARIIDQLLQAGLPLQALVDGVAMGAFTLDFVDSPVYERYAGHTAETFAEVSARTGVPLELLVVLREASGSAPAGPGDLVRPNELEMVPAIQSEFEFGVRPVVIERTIRAMGDAIRRLAEIESAMWASDVVGPILARGGTARDIVAETGGFSERLAPLTDRLILALHHTHQATSWMRNIFESAETVLARAGLIGDLDRPPAICFLDLTGYTRLTDEHGDEAAAETASRLARLVQRTSAAHGGKPIKWLGDGVMFHFREPAAAAVAALEMVDGAVAADLPRAHVGVHAGPVLFQEGDYFGRTVNVAARIADYARQGEVLVSQSVVDLSGGTPGLRFDEIGPVDLKGVAEPVRLHVVRRA